MQINMGGIMNKVRAYNKSAEGKERIANRIDWYRNDGKSTTEGGSKIITFPDMERAGEAMIRCLRYAASTCDPPLPQSVFDHFDSLDCSHVIALDEKRGLYAIYVGFYDDLSRKSLLEEKYEGVRNIVALFNNGYSAKDYVYGHWDMHPPISGSSLHGWSTDTDAFVRSRISREGIHFIQQAVMDFNGNYGSMYNVTAVPGDDYSPDTWVP